VRCHAPFIHSHMCLVVMAGGAWMMMIECLLQEVAQIVVHASSWPWFGGASCLPPLDMCGHAITRWEVRDFHRYHVHLFYFKYFKALRLHVRWQWQHGGGIFMGFKSIYVNKIKSEKRV
jgi:hypothetical protein